MRKFLALAATVILGGALLIAGCGNDNKQAASDGKQVLKIGATAVPHAEILEQHCLRSSDLVGSVVRHLTWL